jgi:hypothetical protein
MRGVLVRVVTLVPLVLALSAGSSAARSAVTTVGVYPSGTTFTGPGAAPPRATTSVSLAMPTGGVDDAIVLVRGAQKVSISSSTIDAPLQISFFFAHYVSVSGKAVPDALLPWDGSRRSPEAPNQPLWLQVRVPHGTAPGAYSGSFVVNADGRRSTIPIAVTVSAVTLPRPDQSAGSLRTAFNMAPQSYGAKVNALYGITPPTSLPALFKFFASYRVSPNNWGYGNPNRASGYTSDRRWWLDKAGQMVAAAGDPAQFAEMWLPISSNRWAPSTYVGRQSPFTPQKWCPYLRSVHSFWQKHNWLGQYAYLWGMDEPGLTRFKIVQKQAAVAHKCFGGSHVIVTGRPTAENRFLWNRGSDDVDAWVVLASRYYGQYTNPIQSRKGISHATDHLKLINAARRRGKEIWTFTYDAGSHDTPGFSATESADDPRVFVDWAAFEGITGLLYGQGTTTYSKGNPLDSIDRGNGSFVLVYPGRDGPIASARLEVLREGIEDWEILNIVRKKRGKATVARLLAGLFSTAGANAKLGCTIGCTLKTPTKYSWPTWSNDSTTPTKIVQMRAAALTAAS